MSEAYTQHQTLDVRIVKIVPGGHGLAFAPKLTLLVDLAVPGDLARVRIRDIKKRLAWAEIVEVLEAGDQRTEPPCPYFGVCGGCDMQQMTYEGQLDAKVGIIRDAFHRIAKLDDVEISIIPSPAPFGYRTRARWHVDPQTRRLGYLKAGSHEIVDVEACPILGDGLAGALVDVRSGVGDLSAAAERYQIEAASGDDDGVSILDPESIYPAADIHFRAAPFTYHYSAETFFQADHSLVPPLVELATGGLSGGLAIDLYSGVGLFALPLSSVFQEVIAVEEGFAAADFARRNAVAASAQIQVERAGVRGFLLRNAGLKPDIVLLDPPRIGPEEGTIQSIISLKPRHVSYVSCDPSILARDLRVLLDAGYRLVSVTAIDLFPQTHHVETVARLESN